MMHLLVPLVCTRLRITMHTPGRVADVPEHSRSATRFYPMWIKSRVLPRYHPRWHCASFARLARAGFIPWKCRSGSANDIRLTSIWAEISKKSVPHFRDWPGTQEKWESTGNARLFTKCNTPPPCVPLSILSGFEMHVRWRWRTAPSIDV